MMEIFPFFYSLFAQPFVEYAFMRRALVTCLALGLSGAPLGVFLIMRRMTLMSDALSHAMLPGVGLAFLFAGASLGAMMAGGIAAALLVAIAGGLIARATPLREDASFTGMYLIALAAGVALISLKGGAADIQHILLGNVLGVDGESLRLTALIASASLLSFAAFYRGICLESYDPDYVRGFGRGGVAMHLLFLTLLTLNLVAAFQALGTLMALGLMVLPALSARFWMRGVDGAVVFSVLFAWMMALAGLLLSYHGDLPSGPAIVLSGGGMYVISLVFGRYGGLLAALPRRHHRTG